MTQRARSIRLIVATVTTALAFAACSSASDPDPAADPTSTTSTTVPASEPTVAIATVEDPPIAGDGAVVLLPPSFDLSTVGYEEHEYFVSGTATSYTSADELTSDGLWSVEPDETAPYTTRIVVRRPSDPATFNGTVYVEWMNVTSGLDIAPDWTFGHVELIREGAAWVGVSAQVVGIDGVEGPSQALALKGLDPARYGPLDHPGDDFSYDMFSQVGGAASNDPLVLGGLVAERLIAMGESQSASRLSTYINAVHPLASVYDAFFVHSRGGGAAALALGTRIGTRGGEQEPLVSAPSPTMIRNDLDVPVMVLSSETDVLGLQLGYRAAHQPDTDLFRSWEVPGTAHLDAYGLGIGDTDDGTGAGDVAAFAAMSDAPTTAYFGFVECESPVNAGPHTYIVRTALHGLDVWVRDGEAPPGMPLLETTDDDTDYLRDDAGNVLGGVRTPHVDVPIARLSGSGQAGQTFCFLFGTTESFDADELAALYPDHATFVDEWNAATDAAVAAGAILPVDGEALKAAAAGSTIGS